MNCPICDGELRVKNTSDKFVEQKGYCTRCKRYAFEAVPSGFTLWVGKLELYGSTKEIESNRIYKKVILQEKIKYKRKKILQKLFKNY